MKSIIQTDKSVCFLCGRNGNGDALEEHHVFFGNPQRKYSEQDGMKVYLCGILCHRNGRNSVHQDKKTDRYLKAEAQRIWESTYGTRERFCERYGKSYL